MAAKKVGVLVKEARTQAGLTQEQLARKVTNATASDISKLERGEVDFTQAQLKEIAKATGVTQTSLINAPKNLGKTAAKKTTTSKSTTSKSASTKSTSSKSSASKSGTAKTSTAKKTTSSSASSSTAKKTSTASKASKTSTLTRAVSSSTNTSIKVSVAEKRLVELYREADGDTKRIVAAILSGEVNLRPAMDAAARQYEARGMRQAPAAPPVLPGQQPQQQPYQAQPQPQPAANEDIVGELLSGLFSLMAGR